MESNIISILDENVELEKNKSEIDAKINILTKKIKVDEDYSKTKDKKRIIIDFGIISVFSSIPVLGFATVLCHNFEYTEAREICARVCVAGISLTIGAIYSKYQYKKRQDIFNKRYSNISFKTYKRLTKTELITIKNEILNLKHDSYRCSYKMRNNDNLISKEFAREKLQKVLK